MTHHGVTRAKAERLVASKPLNELLPERGSRLGFTFDVPGILPYIMALFFGIQVLKEFNVLKRK